MPSVQKECTGPNGGGGQGPGLGGQTDQVSAQVLPLTSCVMVENLYNLHAHPSLKCEDKYAEHECVEGPLAKGNADRDSCCHRGQHRPCRDPVTEEPYADARIWLRVSTSLSGDSPETKNYLKNYCHPLTCHIE